MGLKSKEMIVLAGGLGLLAASVPRIASGAGTRAVRVADEPGPPYTLDQALGVAQEMDSGVNEIHRALRRMKALAELSISGVLETWQYPRTEHEYQKILAAVLVSLDDTEFDGVEILASDAELEVDLAVRGLRPWGMPALGLAPVEVALEGSSVLDTHGAEDALEALGDVRDDVAQAKLTVTGSLLVLGLAASL